MVVHFVNQDNQLLDTKALCKLHVFASLTLLLEASLKLSLSGRDHKTTVISAGGAHDHVGHVVLVAWGVKERDLLCLGLESCANNLYILAPSVLLGVGVHEVGEPTRVTALFFGLLIILLDGAFVNQIEFDHNATTDSGLTRVDVPD